MSDQQPAYQGEGYLSENYGFNMFVHIMVLIIVNILLVPVTAVLG